MKIPVMVEVVTRSIIALDEIYSRKVVNYADKSDRKWLESHVHWSLTHAYQVTITPQIVQLDEVKS